jgi:DNA ligase-associated metallophosphoesterase
MNKPTTLNIKPLLVAREVSFHGHRVELRPSGALFFPDLSALVVADLHLGKALHYSAAGRFLPPYESEATLKKLDAEAQATGADTIVLLGDAFHSARLSAQPDFLPRMVEAMSLRAAPVFVLGNHDRALAQALEKLSCAPHEEWRVEAIRLRHEPDALSGAQILGHLHPCVRVATRAGKQRRACFVVGAETIVMPAFGALAGGLCVTNPALVPYALGADLYLI